MTVFVDVKTNEYRRRIPMGLSRIPCERTVIRIRDVTGQTTVASEVARYLRPFDLYDPSCTGEVMRESLPCVPSHLALSIAKATAFRRLSHLRGHANLDRWFAELHKKIFASTTQKCRPNVVCRVLLYHGRRRALT